MNLLENKNKSLLGRMGVIYIAFCLMVSWFFIRTTYFDVVSNYTIGDYSVRRLYAVLLFAPAIPIQPANPNA